MQNLNRLIVKSIGGDLREGGSVVRADIDGDTDLVQFGDNIRLLGRCLAGFSDFSDREIFNGHVLETPSYDFDAFSSRAEVRIGTANYLMRGGRLDDMGFSEQGSPAHDHELAATMTISDVFTHIVQSHCNFIYNATTAPDGIINSTDIDTADTALARLNVNGSNNFWSALVNQLGGGEEGGVQFYRPYFKRDNTLVYQPAPLFLSSPPASKGTLTKEHIRGRPRVTIRNAKAAERTGQVDLTAVQADNDILTSKYPALQPGDGRTRFYETGIFADTGARLDTLAQNLYEWLTRPYTLELEVDPGLILFGDDGQGLDIGDKVAVTYDGPTEDTATGAGVDLDLSAAAYWVYGYEIRYRANEQSGRGWLTLEADN